MDGVRVHQCVPPLKVFLPIHGPVCWSQSHSSDWVQSMVWSTDMGLQPSLLHVASNPSLGLGNKEEQGTPKVGLSPDRGGD